MQRLLHEYPGEIEADMASVYGIDIADWHRGVLSSSRVLNLIAQLPDTSAMRRCDDWPLAQHLQAGILNEIKAMRADLSALLGGEKMEYTPILPPSETRRIAVKDAASRQLHDRFIASQRHRRGNG